ncbi:hypothetical protein CRUP_037224 [Coryphaenoides rupestris]|nr:hypothetical protein CRUP_037224 [Coryphaenoides rupestris]
MISELEMMSIFPVHPSFRVLALAEPPAAATGLPGGRGQPWLGPELLTMFLFHSVSPLARTEEAGLIRTLVRRTHTHEWEWLREERRG